MSNKETVTNGEGSIFATTGYYWLLQVIEL